MEKRVCSCGGTLHLTDSFHPFGDEMETAQEYICDTCAREWIGYDWLEPFEKK